MHEVIERFIKRQDKPMSQAKLKARINELEGDIKGCVRLIAAQETEINQLRGQKANKTDIILTGIMVIVIMSGVMDYLWVTTTAVVAAIAVVVHSLLDHKVKS